MTTCVISRWQAATYRSAATASTLSMLEETASASTAPEPLTDALSTRTTTARSARYQLLLLYSS